MLLSLLSSSPCLQVATNHKNVVTRAGLSSHLITSHHISSQEAITIILSCDPALPGEDVLIMTVRRLGELRDWSPRAALVTQLPPVASHCCLHSIQCLYCIKPVLRTCSFLCSVEALQ